MLTIHMVRLLITPTENDSIANPSPGTTKEEEALSLDFSRFPAPELDDLMRCVSDDLKCKWKDIASGLGVHNLDNIRSAHEGAVDPNGDCMRHVFGIWKAWMTSEYSWQKIAEVLRSLKEYDCLICLHGFLSEKDHSSQLPQN